MVRSSCFWLTFLALAAMGSYAQGGLEDDEFGKGSRIISVPRYQLGFGLGYRLDALEKETYTPTFQARFFRYFSSELALVGTLEYNNLSRLKYETSFRTAAFGLGVRVEPPFRTLLPMVELGFWIPYYWGTSRGWDIHAWGPGLKVGAGYRVGLGKGMTCDLTISQVLNHVRDEVEVISPASLAPCPEGVDCEHAYYSGPPDDVYNATAIELLLRFGL